MNESSRQLSFDFESLARGACDVMSTREVAKLTGLAERTIRQYRVDGKLPAIQYSKRSFRFLKRDIIAMMSNNYRFDQLN